MLQDRGLSSEILHSPDGDAPSDFMSLLSAAEQRSVVRITGGCAYMTSEDASPMRDLFSHAFNGFRGTVLIGGTRMVDKEDPSILIPGITDVGPSIRRVNPESVLLGVVPRVESLHWNFVTGGLVVERSELTDPGCTTSNTTTLVQSHMDAVVVLGKRISKGPIWRDEAVFCARVTEAQRLYGKWKSTLVVYNGGTTAEFEARLLAKQDWPVILIRGSGRAADKLINDDEFMRQSDETTIVCDLNAASLRAALIQTGVIDPPSTSE